MKKFHSSRRHVAAAPKSSSVKKAKSRGMLYERLEDRVLFDAVPDASLVAHAEEPLNVNQTKAERFDASLYAADVKVVADSSLASQDETSHVADVRRELVIVDTSVENYQQLANDLLMNAEAGREFEIALIDGGTDGISQGSGNHADVHDDGLNGADPNLTNNTASDTDPLVATPDYRLTKTLNGSLTFVEPGQSISYSIFIENIGDQNGTGVVVTDRFPADSLTNVNAVGGTVDATNGTISWDAGDLAGGGESVLLTVTADVRASIATGVEVQNSTNFAGFNLRLFFHPAIHSPMYMNEPIIVGAAFRHDPFSIVQAMHAANNDPLGFDWTHHAYELIVSSSNASAM